MMNKKVIFLGTPEIAKVLLEELYKLDVQLLAVYCQPDRELDRNKNIVYSPVKQFCVKNNIQCFQPENINNSYEQILQLNPDIIITCAYGQFISEKILNIPKYKCVNFHASLLPKLRGGAPIHWAIINGEKKTGITLMYMEKKMDAGNIIKQYEVNIDQNDTYSSLYKKLSDLIVNIVKNDLMMLFNENLFSIEQNEEEATFGLNIKKEETMIDFNKNDTDIYNLIRGLNDKPVAKMLFEGEIIKVFESKLTSWISTKAPGTIINIDKSGLLISTKKNDILITKIQLPSKRPLDISQIINGKHNFLVGKIIK